MVKSCFLPFVVDNIIMQTACDQVEGLTATTAQQQAPQSMMFHQILWSQHLYLKTSGEVGENCDQ